MDNATYVKNALKTFSNRPAQLGLRRAASNLRRTHLMHAGMGLLSEMAEVFEVLQPWLLGAEQLNPQMKSYAKDELGDVGYFMAVLAKRLKVRLPGAGKKLRLKQGTPSEALHEMLTLANRIASLQKKNFYGPAMKTTLSEAGRPQVDVEATVAQERERYAKMSALVASFAKLYWPVCNELFGEAPASLFEANIKKLAVRYPEGFFSSEKEATKNPDAELSAQTP